MTALTVWAPNANKVEVEAGQGRHRLTACDDGWWNTELSISESGAEYDYMFRLHGGQPLPDPRSPWQPNGIDGPTRLIDHTTFPWTDGRW
jgi:maltooligosyltrehalose trehalohydrolase